MEHCVCIVADSYTAVLANLAIDRSVYHVSDRHLSPSAAPEIESRGHTMCSVQTTGSSCCKTAAVNKTHIVKLCEVQANIII